MTTMPPTDTSDAPPTREDPVADQRARGLFKEIDTGGQYKRFMPEINSNYGDLTVLGVVKEGRKGTWFLLRCNACGHEVVRYVGSLNYSARRGHHQSCLACARESYQGRGEALGEIKRERLRQMWETHRSLYNKFDEQNLAEDVWGDLSAEFGEVEDNPRPPTVNANEFWGREDHPDAELVGVPYTVRCASGSVFHYNPAPPKSKSAVVENGVDAAASAGAPTVSVPGVDLTEPVATEATAQLDRLLRNARQRFAGAVMQCRAQGYNVDQTAAHLIRQLGPVLVHRVVQSESGAVFFEMIASCGLPDDCSILSESGKTYLICLRHACLAITDVQCAVAQRIAGELARGIAQNVGPGALATYIISTLGRETVSVVVPEETAAHVENTADYFMLRIANCGLDHGWFVAWQITKTYAVMVHGHLFAQLYPIKTGETR